MSTFDLGQQPQSRSCRLLEFAEARVVAGFVTGTFVLVVEGVSPCANMAITLAPVTYARCPEYWEIEVVGCLPNGTCLAQIAPFTRTLDLSGIIGAMGIEVVGANRSERIAVSGGCKG